MTCRRRWIRSLVLGTGGVALVCACAAGPVWAQVQAVPPQKTQKPQKPKGDPKWTLQVHGGTSMRPTPTGGSAGQFPTGALLMTDAGFNTRTHSSWYFGDGSALFNEVRGQFASRFNVNYPQIAPLDGMLTSAAGHRKGGPAFGVRLGRQITRRFGVEFGFDRSQGTLEVSGGARSAIEATRASFETAFNGLLATIPQTGLRVTSTADLEDADANQTAVTAALTIALVDNARFAIHALAGGGRVTNSEDAAEVRLRGNYQFRLFDTYAFNETDLVTIRVTERDSSTIGLFGGGITYDVGKRHGLRVDVRALVGSNGLTTSVDATPTSASVVPAIALPSNTNPSMQFSSLSGVRSSLSGATTRLTTFSGDGLDTRVLITAGYFVRF